MIQILHQSSIFYKKKCPDINAGAIFDLLIKINDIMQQKAPFSKWSFLPYFYVASWKKGEN